jgi:maltose alpha-D-glucosyltransferase/alpha-amylase
MEQFEKYVRILYREKADTILREVKSEVNGHTIIEKPAPNDQWYRNISLYAVYPDTFQQYKDSPLAQITNHIEYVKKLGCNAIHILPFLESPMVDKGFDVSNFMRIRPELGSMKDIEKIISVAKENGVKVFMDLVFNHVSDQHMWFKKALGGDEKYRDYFIHQKNKPQFKKKFHKDSAVWAQYGINGDAQDINIAFPEYTGEIPHWTKGKDSYWYYHTYYPQQLDVNWRNPDVFVEFAKILIYWSKKGFNFRLDAIPFVGKGPYKNVDENTKFTKLLIASLRSLAQCINPESVFIVESYEKEKTIIEYFGDTNVRQAELSYNFHLCTSLWVSMVTGKSEYIWDKLRTLKKIPNHGVWVNFLRNHDELSLAYLDDDTLKKVFKALSKNGEPFREGYGISGRTYSLLDHDEKRFLHAYFLLACMPGGLLIPYGDELGKTNIETDSSDTREINRGNLTKKEIDSAKGKRIFEKIQEFLENRSYLNDYINVWPEKLSAPDSVYAAQYVSGSSKLITMVNLTDKEQKVPLKTEGYQIKNKLYAVKVDDDGVILSPYAGVWIQK